jgi:hypothetical protein
MSTDPTSPTAVEHPNYFGEGTHTPSWIVTRTSITGGQPNSYGPFPDHDAAKDFASHGGHVICFTCNNQSPCSAWYY